MRKRKKERSKLKERGKLIVLSGPSGAGKTTVVKKMMERRSDVCFSVSVTTRQPRPGEVDGKDYFFISEEKFRSMVDAGELLEHADYVSHSYGTPRDYVMRNLENGMNVVLDIEVKGAHQIREKCPDAVFVFFAPPSLSVLRSRLEGRGTEGRETIEKRLAKAEQEYAQADCYDWLVVNNSVDAAVKELSSIITAAQCTDTAEKTPEELSAVSVASECRFCDRKDILK